MTNPIPKRNPTQGLPNNLQPTRFGQASGNLSQNLQQNSRVVGSYGNYGQQNVQNNLPFQPVQQGNRVAIPQQVQAPRTAQPPAPHAVIPAPSPAITTNPQNAHFLTNTYNPNSSREKLKHLIQENAKKTERVQKIAPVVTNMTMTGVGNVNSTTQQSQPQTPPINNAQSIGPRVIPRVEAMPAVNVIPTRQIAGTNISKPPQTGNGNFFTNLFGTGQKKPAAALQQKPTSSGVQANVLPSAPKSVDKLPVDKNSPEYLKTLSASDLRKEVIKTEIEIQKAIIDTEKSYREGVSTIRDLISPSAVNVTGSHIELNTKLVRSFFVLVYPRVITSGWLEGLVNADLELDISIFIYPRDSSDVLRELRGKVGKIQASLNLNNEQGKARDPQLETAYRDVEGLRDAIQQGVEKFFRVGVYIQIYANTIDQLEKTSQTVEGILSQQSILIKRSALQMDDGFNSNLPILMDNLDVVTNMNTSPLSACFPFVSSDLSSDSGILYGINRHNSSLIIFDRFELENANSLVFATSGAGKSFAVKLEILRSRMLGVGVIVIDPEAEYKVLADSLGGVYVNFSLNSTNRINPFDLPKALPGESTADIIRSAIIDLMGLMNLMLGKLNPTEVSIMEKAIQESYNKKDITPDCDLSTVTPPTMTDLVEILQGIVGGDSLAQRLYRYTEGTFAGIFNKPTNVNINNDFIVFSIRDLQETLRPIAMYVLLKYVWTEIRSNLKKRILTVDEAWILMQYEDSARFLYGLAKRARKYYLGITTISQDVTDFLSSPLGKPIVTNAAMKLLLKQSSAAIDQVADTFALTSGEIRSRTGNFLCRATTRCD
jgi:conjugal transfer ATP-binding protein TraC